MSKLYAIVDGENVPVANLSDEDSQKVGRGYDTGHSFGVVTDLDTNKQFEVLQASCGSSNCNCAVTVQEV